MHRARIVRLLALTMALGTSVLMAETSMNPGSGTGANPCPANQCAYGTGCYSDGACVGCQRCHTPVSGSEEPRWRDDRTCPGCSTGSLGGSGTPD